MQRVECYTYPAIFTYESGQEIAVTFPDLQCATSGVDDEDALLSAKELLECVLIGLKEDKEPIPEPTPLETIKTQSNEHAVSIEISMLSMETHPASTAVKLKWFRKENIKEDGIR